MAVGSSRIWNVAAAQQGVGAVVRRLGVASGLVIGGLEGNPPLADAAADRSNPVRVPTLGIARDTGVARLPPGADGGFDLRLLE